MRCEQCNRFVAYEGDEEPEVTEENLEVVGEKNKAPSEILYNVSVRAVKNCAECSTELKSADFEFEGTVPEEFIAEHWRGKDEWGIECEASASESSEGAGRYAKTYYGVDLSVVVTAPDGETWEESLEDRLQASSWEECC
jgi:hypothetical protein